MCFIKKPELKKALSENFYIIEKRYYLISPIIDWWSKFSTTHRISIVTLFVTTFFTAFYFFLSLSLDNQYTDLKDKYDKLENKHIQLKKTLIITSDSLRVEHDLSRQLRKPIMISDCFKNR